MTVDYRNHGLAQEMTGCTAMLVKESESTFIGDLLQLHDCSSLFALRLTLKRSLSKCEVSKCPNLFAKLVANLSKNNRELRIATLKLLDRAFSEVPYDTYNPAVHTAIDLESAKRYSGPCPLIPLLLKFESAEVDITYEKIKGSSLRDVQVLLTTGLVPPEYIKTIYVFLVGCLWIKFLPIYEPTFACFTELFT